MVSVVVLVIDVVTVKAAYTDSTTAYQRKWQLMTM